VQAISASIPLNWKAVLPPRSLSLRGRYARLEPLEASRHCPALWQAVRGHDEVWAWLSDGPFATEPDLRRALAEKQAATNTVFLAIIPEDVGDAGRAAGYASYMRMEPAHGVVEVGNIMLAPVLQRTRAATEAMYLMASHVFDELGYRRYEWKCNAQNEPSRQAALRLGFSFEGIFRQHMVIKGRNRDTAWFAMLDHEWPARKRAMEQWLDPANFGPSGAQIERLSR
jgi:RimJ/RimL family protein N-acetyltransferase